VSAVPEPSIPVSLFEAGSPLAPQPVVAPTPEPAPIAEPVFNTGLANATSFFREMPEPEPEPPAAEQITVDDLEVPAFMRRERRLYQ
jgi:hypothetical protein